MSEKTGGPESGSKSGPAKAPNSNAEKTGSGATPRGGMPGDGAGRIENTESQHAGVWPASGPLPDDPDVRYQPMASFGQGERGAAGYEDSGRSEAMTVPPGAPDADQHGSGSEQQATGGNAKSGSSGGSGTSDKSR